MKSKFKKSVLLLFMLIGLAATTFSQTVEEIKAKIEMINREMSQAMIAGNSEKSLAFYSNDAISMPSNENMSRGKAAIKKANEEMMKSGVKVLSFEPKIMDLKVCNTLITEVGTYKIGLSIPGMEGVTEDVGKYVTLWEKQSDGSLLIKVEIWNSDVNHMKQ